MTDSMSLDEPVATHHGLERGAVDDESDAEDVSPSSFPLDESQRRTAQTARFKQWMLRQARIAIDRPKKSKAEGDEQLSIRELMAEQESTSIITDPREYQIELFERAKEQNTIAVLDTGTGKTLIAVLLLRYILDQELENRQAGLKPRIAFFLVPSVNLVFQQFAVLECNLDHKVARFCGAMGTDLWTKDVWADHFEKHKVIVCTAEVLHQCLAHAFVTMDQINLLIFDESHHAKLEHPYSKRVFFLRIIRDYYKPLTAETRPRIFGMTASPVDAKVDVVEAAEDLENLLHSRITTTKDLTLLRRTVHRAEEQVLRYASSPTPVKSSLYQQLEERFAALGILDRVFQRARYTSEHLGSWASDYYWKLALPERIAAKAEGQLERTFRLRHTEKTTTNLDTEVALFREALALVHAHILREPVESSSDMSAKVLRLHDFLQLHFSTTTDTRCIVFVEQRHTARLLSKIFEHIGGPHLRPGSLVGSGSVSISDVSVSFREQIVTMIKFRSGGINCLFATSVAEEGLDVPHCNLVVRFDPCKTMIQYVQSRGRARHQNSKFVHMIEIGNVDHDILLADNRQAEQLMRRFCAKLPDDRYLQGNDDMSEDMQNYHGQKPYVVPSTGAKITYANCMQILAHFVGSLPSEGDEVLLPTYIVTSQLNQFVCEVILPVCSPYPGDVGIPRKRKALAKCAAAFAICKELRKRGLLDENLLPTYKKRLNPMRNAALALNMKNTGKYEMRLKPSFWQTHSGAIPQRLHLLLIDLPNGLDWQHQALILLSREKLPSFPEFPLYLSSGASSKVCTLPIHDSIEVYEDTVANLTTFTLRIFKDIFNKTYENDATKTPYWLVPSRVRTNDAAQAPNDMIDWKAVHEVCTHGEHKWSPEMSPASLVNKFIVDPYSGANRWFSTRLATEHKPLDPLPADAAKGRYNENILDASISLWLKAKQKAQWNLDQPVLQAEKVMLRRNLLAQQEADVTNLTTKAFLCPEPLKISTLHPEFVTTCLAFPAIIHRIDSYLIGLETCAQLGLRVETSLALEAITKDSDNTGDHDQNHERINFQRGMGRNYERLEFLGDCFLKTTTSMAVFIKYPLDTEFDYHVKRMLMLCNNNLYNVAVDKGLFIFVRSQAFSRRTWYPEGLKLLEGKGHKSTNEEVAKHDLGDKTIADVCEAIIGAAFLTHNNPQDWNAESWTDSVQAVTKLVDNDDHTMMKWSDYVDAYTKPNYQLESATASQLDLAAKVELEHAYHFQYPRLLQSAFLHPSQPYSWSRVPSYQRLEFLGDSLLDLACVAHLFYGYPDKDPQWLTEHKMAMVANKFLGALCIKLGFHRHLRHNSSIIASQINHYATELGEAENTPGSGKDYWTTVKNPPKCLADMVEAYIGAIFIDSGFNYGVVQRFFDTHVRPFFDDMAIYDTFANDSPINRIFHMLDETFGCHGYRLMADEIPSGDARPPQIISAIMVHNEVVAGHTAKSLRYAKMRAASNAVQALEGLAPYEFRNKFGCDCKASDSIGGIETGA